MSWKHCETWNLKLNKSVMNEISEASFLDGSYSYIRKTMRVWWAESPETTVRDLTQQTKWLLLLRGWKWKIDVKDEPWIQVTTRKTTGSKVKNNMPSNENRGQQYPVVLRRKVLFNIKFMGASYKTNRFSISNNCDGLESSFMESHALILGFTTVATMSRPSTDIRRVLSNLWVWK